MNFELVDHNGWRLIAPSRGWAPSHGRAMLPNYFSGEEIGSYSRPINNYFYATYRINNKSELAIFVSNPGSFVVDKTIIKTTEYTSTYYQTNENVCTNETTKETIVGINKVDVEFDNTSVYFLTQNGKKTGLEQKDNSTEWQIGKKLGHSIYDLASEAVLLEKQPDNSMEPTYKYHNFYFFFENMTCRDYENATFVIDGFYYQGKRLPPLKVRMKYYDFGVVPAYKETQKLPK